MAERTFDQLVKSYPAPVADLARQARDFVLGVMGAGARESIDASGPYAFYSYASLDSAGLARDKPGYKGLVCSLILSKTGVKLGVAHGAALDDPQGLLEGAGKVHKSIALKSPADLEKPGVKALVQAAIKACRARTR